MKPSGFINDTRVKLSLLLALIAHLLDSVEIMLQ